MKIRTLTVALLRVGSVALVGSLACSSVSEQQACTDLANAICAKANQCVPAVVQGVYGDTSTCATVVDGSCKQTLGVTSTSDTPSSVETCAQAYANISCGDALQNNPPKACQQTAGKLAAGAVCGTDGQCTTGACLAIGGSNGCGVCGTRVAAGSACLVASDCQYGLVCALNATNNLVCVAPAASGAACATTPCQTGLVCAGTTGNKKCAAPLSAGSACDPAQQPCDSAAGYWCNPLQTRCSPVKFAAAGATCGYDTATGDLTLCADSGFCTKQTGGTCLAAAALGATCSATAGPLCAPPNTCQNGTCTAPTDPSSCK